MNYTNILFDLDNTIFDTQKNATLALHKMRIAKSFSFDSEKMNWWFKVNDLLWGKFENGSISRKELLDSRFKTFFGKYNIEVDSAKFEKEFQALFAAEHSLMPNVISMLEAVNQNHNLFVVSNGSKQKQLTQLAGADISKYFNEIFLAEDIGFKKPDTQFFDSVQSDINGATLSNMLVVGDSLSADIDGANRSHIDSVWYDTKNAGNDSEIKSTYTITNLNQLTKIV
ncbi:YjjG family noncanonical pyrimidine nucleotidase [Companilactobacillus baiquanensis]|uniref:YjjG family noncanonical pyrimidine nucleotidase n=1 Tax=Companilactobacillus baiquanensis TaxID=2486005 RepID=A0ABW1UTY3_9LACO|nr:YjjG family noncanonical pyrimidine nucleotidase [Companilactobacillus baiquanensis]